MADTKISALSELAALPDATDELVLVDKSDTSMAASGTDKRIQFSNLLGGTLAGNLSAGTQAVRSVSSTAPTIAAIITSASGGALTSATYYYKISALDADGNESAASAESNIAVTGPTGTVTLTWAYVPGALTYRVYRGTSAGAENTYFVTGGNRSVVDRGDAGIMASGSPPGSGTQYDNALKRNGAGWFSGKRFDVVQDWTTPISKISRGFDVEITAKQSGTVQDGHAGIRSRAADRTDVTEKAITNAVNNGSGLIRITATGHGYATGDRITVDAVGGVTAANGLWTITSIDANTFDLQNSTFAGTYTSGGVATNRGLMYAGLFLIEPRVDRGTTANLNGDDAVGLVITNNGSAKATEGVYIGTSGNQTVSFTHGVAVDAPATNAYKVGARAFDRGLDLSSATYTDVAIKFGAAHNISFDTATGTKIGTATTQKIGFWNATPVVRPSAYTVSNVTTDRTYNANSYTMDELADVLGTLIADLQSVGLLG